MGITEGGGGRGGEQRAGVGKGKEGGCGTKKGRERGLRIRGRGDRGSGRGRRGDGRYQLRKDAGGQIRSRKREQGQPGKKMKTGGWWAGMIGARGVRLLFSLYSASHAHETIQGETGGWGEGALASPIDRKKGSLMIHEAPFQGHGGTAPKGPALNEQSVGQDMSRSRSGVLSMH